MYFRLSLVFFVSSLFITLLSPLSSLYADDEALEHFLSHPLIPLLDTGSATEKLSLKAYASYKNLNCSSIIKNKQLRFEQPETLFCLDQQVVNSLTQYDDQLLISIVNQLERSSSPLKKVFFEEFLLRLFTTNSTVDRLEVIGHLLAMGVSPEKVRAMDGFTFYNLEQSERNLILAMFSQSTNSSKKDIVNKLFQQKAHLYAFDMFHSYYYATKAISLIKAGASTERLNVKIYQDFTKLDCKNVLKKKQLRFEKPETLLCLSNYVLYSPGKYSDDLLIEIINRLNRSKHPLKKAFFADVLAAISANIAVQRFAVTEHLFNIGASPEKIQKVEEGLGNERLCEVRDKIYDFQHQYFKKHSLPPLEIDLGYMMDTNSCHRVVCNDLIIKMVNRNKNLRKVGEPVARMLGEFKLTGSDLKLLNAFVTPENVNDRDINDLTVLEMLVDNGINHSETSAMKMLIDMGANIYLKNNKGKSVHDTINSDPYYFDEIRKYAKKYSRKP